ncbi:hypothetical protein IEQ34_001072 [Dendrobium chrysotoxum]|uniref:Uncharacterized protein n=1 Tax=Dendrobium chrysotoxum TaxID=161865 RepID=A0AAV7H6S0_DENCH|nr:hypothetical protein IEQ34_001072 [Dendrobium chrysotoxum]
MAPGYLLHRRTASLHTGTTSSLDLRLRRQRRGDWRRADGGGVGNLGRRMRRPVRRRPRRQGRGSVKERGSLENADGLQDRATYFRCRSENKWTNF